jgi:hypothetical protein
MRNLNVLFPISCVAVLTTVAFTACGEGGNSYSGSGTLQLAAGDLDSTEMVYANVDESKESDGTYASNFYVGSTSYQEFELSHYVRSGAFVGGLTATNMTDSTTLSADNYACIVGHGASSNKTYFVGDLNKTCAITFHTDYLYSVPLSPTFVMVTNAAYTYLAMEQGTDEYPAFTEADYLTLHIIALNKNGGATGKEVTFDLASRGKFQREWKRVDLTELGECYGVAFTLESTGGTTGLNISTPPRFCIDFLTATYSYSFDY